MANFVTYSYRLKGTEEQIQEADRKFREWSNDASCTEGLGYTLARELMGYSSDMDVEDYHHYELNSNWISLHSGECFSVRFDITSDIGALGWSIAGSFPELEVSGYIDYEGFSSHKTFSPAGSTKVLGPSDCIYYQVLPSPLPGENEINFTNMTQSVSCPYCNAMQIVDLKTIKKQPFNEECYEHDLSNEDNYTGDFVTHCSEPECQRFFRVVYSTDKYSELYDDFYGDDDYDNQTPFNHLYSFNHVPTKLSDIVTPGYEPFFVEGTTIKKLYIKENDDLVIPEGITCIAANALEECSVGKLIMPTTLTTIENNAFYNATIDNIVLPSGIKTLQSRTFRSACVGNLTLSSNLESIGENCFKGSDISKLTIPSSVKSIGKDAFARGSFDELHFPNSKATFEKTIGIPKRTKVYAPASSPVGTYTKKGNTGGILQ